MLPIFQQYFQSAGEDVFYTRGDPRDPRMGDEDAEKAGNTD